MHTIAAVLLFLATLSRPTPVEVLVPVSPVPVATEQGRVLAYELHVTNFGGTPFQLRRIDVADEKAAPVASFEGATLAPMLDLVGAPASSPQSLLDPGRRLVVFLWIALPPAAKMPATRRHRLTFDVPGSPDQSVLDNIDVRVAPGPVPRLTPPFASGDWLAGEGPSVTSNHRRTIAALEGKTWSSQRFAIDWVRVGPNGNTFHDSRKSNENFWAFGQPVHAVADGEVTEAVDAFPDNPPDQPLRPLTLENIVGNHVIIRIGPDQYVVFGHLQSHSIRVRLHDRVRRGDVIALVGNSGNTTGPHLHLEVMDHNSPLGSQGLPFVFDRFTFIGHGRDFEEDKHPVEPRTNEMPVDDDVVRFGATP